MYLKLSRPKDSYITSLSVTNKMDKQGDQILKKKENPADSWCYMPCLFLSEKKYSAS